MSRFVKQHVSSLYHAFLIKKGNLWGSGQQNQQANISNRRMEQVFHPKLGWRWRKDYCDLDSLYHFQIIQRNLNYPTIWSLNHIILPLSPYPTEVLWRSCLHLLSGGPKQLIAKLCCSDYWSLAKDITLGLTLWKKRMIISFRIEQQKGLCFPWRINDLSFCYFLLCEQWDSELWSRDLILYLSTNDLTLLWIISHLKSKGRKITHPSLISMLLSAYLKNSAWRK